MRDENYIYWAPFSIHVWFCILFLCLTLTLVLTFILRRESKLPHKISYDIFARLIDVQEDGDENKSVKININLKYNETVNNGRLITGMENYPTHLKNHYIREKNGK